MTSWRSIGSSWRSGASGETGGEMGGGETGGDTAVPTGSGGSQPDTGEVPTTGESDPDDPGGQEGGLSGIPVTTAFTTGVDQEDGCACATSPQRTGPLVWLLGLGALRRRRADRPIARP